MINLIEDISTLTSINTKALEKLVNVAIYSINDAVAESRITGEEITKVDIGLGELLIKLDNGQIKYKFIPSAKFEDSIKDTVINRENILELHIEEALRDKVVNTYKDLT